MNNFISKHKNNLGDHTLLDVGVWGTISYGLILNTVLRTPKYTPEQLKTSVF
jgi:hypothetical protein